MPLPITGSALPPWAYNNTTLPPWVSNKSILPPWMNNKSPQQIPPRTRPPVSQNIPSPQTRTAPAGRGGVGATWMGTPNIPQMKPQAPVMRPPVAPPINYSNDNIMKDLLNSTQTANTKGAGDYSDIMAKLGGMLNQPNTTYEPYSPIDETFDFEQPTNSTYTPYKPTNQVYEESPRFSEAYGKMQNLADTGGYGEADLANLRARGISPIRSVYANAMQSLDRNKALQGGYGPGHAAATTRMSRDLSEQLSGATTNVNAKIAEMVAAGKQAAIPQMLAAAQQENEYKNSITGRNTDAANRAGEVNAQGMFESDKVNKDRLMDLITKKQAVSTRNVDAKNKANEFNKKMKFDTDTSNKNRDVEIMSQMRSLYGTTPGLADTFSKNALSTAELATKLKQMKQTGQLNERELEQKGGLGLIDAFIRSLGR